MEDIIRQVLAILQGGWKYRWAGLAVAWLVGIAGSIAMWRVPDHFQASARIFVDTQSILRPLMSGLALQPNVDQQVALLSRTLISRPNVEKLIRMADLDLKSSSKSQQDALVDSLMRSVRIGSAGRDNVYVVSYAAADQEKAKKVVQSMVSIFVESSLGDSRKGLSSAKTFLDEQIKVYEGKLEEAEKRRKDFRLHNIDLANPDGKDAASRLAQVSQQFDQAKLELREAENAREAARAQLQAEKSQGQGQGPSLVTQSLLQESAIQVSTPEVDARLIEHKRNLDGLLQRFTDQHPDVISTRKRIKELDEQKQREVTELRKIAFAAPAAPAPAAVINPALVELGRVVAAAEVQVASLKARVAEYASRVGVARAGMKVAPEREAEAAQLNRDYGIIRKNFEDLVTRRQTAEMSGELEVASGVADFRLIDPPRVSPKPVSPNRVWLTAGALASALISGLLVALALSQLRPVFSDASDLRAKTSLPVLGVVSLLLGEQDMRRNRADQIRFMAGFGSFLGLFAIGLAWLYYQAAR